MLSCIHVCVGRVGRGSGTIKEELIFTTETIQCKLETTCTEREAQMQRKEMLGEGSRLTLFRAQGV